MLLRTELHSTVCKADTLPKSTFTLSFSLHFTLLFNLSVRLTGLNYITFSGISASNCTGTMKETKRKKGGRVMNMGHFLI